MNRTAHTALLATLCLPACSQDNFLPFEIDADQALIVASGDSEVRKVELDRASSTGAVVVSLDESLPRVAMWRLREADFVPAPLTTQLDFQSLSVSKADASRGCACLAPAVSSLAPAIGGQTCPIPDFVEGSLYELQSRNLEPQSDAALLSRFGTNVALEWAGPCAESIAPASPTALLRCAIGDELSVNPVTAAADEHFVVGLAAGRGVAIANDLEAVEFDVPYDTVPQFVDAVASDDTLSRFVASGSIENVEEYFVIEITRQGPTGAPSARVVSFDVPNERSLSIGVRDIIPGDLDRFEIFSASGGEFGESRILRCSTPSNGTPICTDLNLGACRTAGERLSSGVRLPDGSAMGFTGRGMLFAQQKVGADWSCGPPVPGLRAPIDNEPRDFTGPKQFAVSGDQIVACFEARIGGVPASAAVASAPFTPLSFSASGDLLSPLTVSWRVLTVLTGECKGATHTPRGNLGVVVLNDPNAFGTSGGIQSTFVEVDSSTGELIDTHRSFGQVPAAGFPGTGSLVALAEQRRSQDQQILIGVDGLITETASAAARQIYGPPVYSSESVTAIATSDDALSAVVRGPTQYIVRADGEPSSCSDLVTQERSISGLSADAVPIALSAAGATRWLLSVEEPSGASLILLDDSSIMKRIETKEAAVALSHLGGEAFAVVFASGRLALLVDDAIIDIPSDAHWLEAAPGGEGLAWVGGEDVLGRLFLTSATTAKLESDWLARIAPPEWTSDRVIHPILVQRITSHHNRAWSIGTRIHSQDQAETVVHDQGVHGLMSASPSGLVLSEVGRLSGPILGFGDDPLFSIHNYSAASFGVGENGTFVGLPYGRVTNAASRGRITLVGAKYGRVFAIVAK